MVGLYILLQKPMSIIKQLPKRSVEEPVLYRETSPNFSKLEKAQCLKMIIGNILCTYSPFIQSCLPSNPSRWVQVSSSQESTRVHFTYISSNPRVCHIFLNPATVPTSTIGLLHTNYIYYFYLSVSVLKVYQVLGRCLSSR